MTAFNVNKVSLWNALQFNCSSPRARMLRAAAIQRGGIVYTGRIPDGYIPPVSTEFDHSKGIIVQKFGAAAKITIDKSTATIEIPGAVPITIDGVTVAQWERLLYSVQMLLCEL